MQKRAKIRIKYLYELSIHDLPLVNSSVNSRFIYFKRGIAHDEKLSLPQIIQKYNTDEEEKMYIYTIMLMHAVKPTKNAGMYTLIMPYPNYQEFPIYFITS